jgi:S-methylmethionine-dependent homocysteine/selenocysteine methylase
VHLLAYPNSGEGWDARARAWLDGTGLAPDAFGAAAAGWADAGATVIGGARPRSLCDQVTLARCASCRRMSSVHILMSARTAGCCRTGPEHIRAVSEALAAAPRAAYQFSG